jgi:hypothetical protein
MRARIENGAALTVRAMPAAIGNSGFNPAPPFHTTTNQSISGPITVDFQKVIVILRELLYRGTLYSIFWAWYQVKLTYEAGHCANNFSFLTMPYNGSGFGLINESDLFTVSSPGIQLI